MEPVKKNNRTFLRIVINMQNIKVTWIQDVKNNKAPGLDRLPSKDMKKKIPGSPHERFEHANRKQRCEIEKWLSGSYQKTSKKSIPSRKLPPCYINVCPSANIENYSAENQTRTGQKDFFIPVCLHDGKIDRSCGTGS